MYFIAVLYIEQVCKVREHVKKFAFSAEKSAKGGGVDPRLLRSFSLIFLKEGRRFEMKICIIFFVQVLYDRVIPVHFKSFFSVCQFLLYMIF